MMLCQRRDKNRRHRSDDLTPSKATAQFCGSAYRAKIEQERPVRGATSHTTVRTVRYTAVQSHKCRDSYRSDRLKNPACASLSFVIERVSTGLPATRQYPYRFTTVSLHHAAIPPYTPEMNPIEQIWKELRKMGFRNEVFETLERVVERLCDTICALSMETIRSITGRQWILNCFIED